MNRVEKISLGLTMLALAEPALAGVPATPAPVAGIGIGAVVLMGIGYRVLKSRVGR